MTGKKKQHWTEKFFTDRYGRVGLETKWEQAAEEAANVKRALKLRKGERVLDLCCGIGRHSIALAKLGLSVTGLDLNLSYLGQARARARRAGVKAHFLRGDMRALPFEDEFHAVLSLFTSFGYYDDETNLRVLVGVARALRPGGKFLIEIGNRDWLVQNFRPWDVSEMGRDLVLEHREYDPLTSRVKSSWRLVRGRKVIEMGGFELRLYAPNELRALIEAAGMTMIASSGGLDRSPLQTVSRRLALAARKNG
jgi:SAM-dependent methyltransferase